MDSQIFSERDFLFLECLSLVIRAIAYNFIEKL